MLLESAHDVTSELGDILAGQAKADYDKRFPALGR
jgi:hypothetical protein